MEELEQLARKKYSSLQDLLKYRALTNAVIVPGPYCEANVELRAFITDLYNSTIEEIEKNEWYVNEIESMKKLSKEMAEENDDIDPDLKIKMSDVFKVVA